MSERTAFVTDDVEVDVRSLMRSLVRKLPYLIVFALIVGGGTYYMLSRIPPSYKAETTVLIEPGESSFTRPETATPETTAVLDKEAITSQVQLIRSRDLASAVATRLDLESRPEYEDAINGGSFLHDLLAGWGLASDPGTVSVEQKVLAEYYKNLEVYAVQDSRVISINFSSTDPQLAADGANTIAAEYITLQRDARQDTNADATKWLESEIADLRTKVTDAEAKVETFRASNDLFSTGTATGQGPATLPQQQLADLNAELTRVRAARAAAQAKAAQIRALLKTGQVPNITDVLNSQLIQRLIEQQVALRAQIAELSATYLPGHPRMKALNAQIADLDQQVGREAQKIVDALEAETQLSETREAEIQTSLTQLKATAATANDSSVQLRALEREAAAQRDLLDTYLRRYREAAARQNGEFLPADARIISRATVPIDPSFPKVLPMTAAATVAALILAIAVILVRELASGRPMRRVRFGAPLPVVPDAVPVEGHLRWTDDSGIRRMMPAEPTLALPIPGEAERSLATIADRLVAEDRHRILVTLAEGTPEADRPLAAVALARALARLDRRVVLVDLRGDGADGATMGQGTDLPGFTDLFAGEASFAQVIFRDRKSRAHFIPVGRQPVSAEGLAEARLTTLLDALDHTYDHVVIDAGDALVPVFGRSIGAAMVVSEFGAADPRTTRSFERIAALSSAPILLLAVDRAPKPAAPAAADEAAA